MPSFTAIHRQRFTVYFRNYSVGTIPRGVFCEQSSQKTREMQREIMLA